MLLKILYFVCKKRYHWKFSNGTNRHPYWRGTGIWRLLMFLRFGSWRRRRQLEHKEVTHFWQKSYGNLLNSGCIPAVCNRVLAIWGILACNFVYNLALSLYADYQINTLLMKVQVFLSHESVAYTVMKLNYYYEKSK